MTKEEFLQSTIEYYGADENRRCSNANMKTCYYSPVNAGKQGVSDGCAIGRHLDAATQVKLDALEETRISDILESPVDKKLLPSWLRKLGKEFLVRVQALHDNPVNWERVGLSDGGKYEVNNIINTFKLDMPLCN